ncbi:MAG: hypothetical protein ACI892_000318, partial [Marinobacter maritimus]
MSFLSFYSLRCKKQDATPLPSAAKNGQLDMFTPDGNLDASDWLDTL